jgi:4,5-dihydroxyphthalate decarboxylase
MASIPLSLVFREEYLARTREALGDDPFPYGLEPNRAALQTLIDYSNEQGLTSEKADVEDLFVPSVIEWAEMAPG